MNRYEDENKSEHRSKKSAQVQNGYKSETKAKFLITPFLQGGPLQVSWWLGSNKIKRDDYVSLFEFGLN